MTNTELANHLNIVPNTVRRWLSGQVKSIQGETAILLSEMISYDVQAVLQGHPVDLKKPVLEMIKTEQNLFLEQNYLGDEIVSVDEYKSGDYF